MNKKEKYYNYVVNHLVKKTKIDYGKERVIFPFSIIDPQFAFFTPKLLIDSFLPDFTNYVKERYGVHDEEIEFIWDQYKERIQSLINNG
jgi:alcohol dehydrogenase YqhD (iron-dependent ADH family)